METVQAIKVSKTLREISLSAAKVSWYTTVAFMFLLVLLHFVKADLDPSWRMISEYAIGENGWLMVLAFLSWATSYVALVFSIRSQVHNLAGKIGLVLLLIGALGIVMAAIFVTDPVITRPEAISTSGMLHNLGGTLGLVFPFGIMLISWSLFKNPNWSGAARPVLWSGILAVAGSLITIISMGALLSETNGMIGPDTPVGYPMRFEVFTYCIWLIVVARQALYLRSRN